MLNVVCVRVGEAYGPEYVTILQNMVARHLDGVDHAFWCVTDDADNLPHGVNVIPANPQMPGWWQKLYLFSGDMPWKDGERVLYFDLDVAITGRLEPMAEGDTPMIIADWNWPGQFNSSVMAWNHGELRDVWERFTPAMMKWESPPELQGLLPKGQINGGDQEWITRTSNGRWATWPEEWCASYRGSATNWMPPGARVVVFHGHPKPADVVSGWVPEVWKKNGLTALPEMRGVNVTLEAILSNICSNVQRDLPWFSGFPRRKGAVALVCGGPSMKDSLTDIRAQKRRGAKIVSVNNALRFLVENGVTPDAHVMLDARPENAEFVRDAPEGVRYFIASQCHPAVLDALEGREVVLWHNGFGDGEALAEIVAPWWETKPVIQIPGGGTVGLRALWLIHESGYRTIHVYGMDSSFEDDAHHAYPQPLNDADGRVIVKFNRREYTCARWMARQANEFQEHYIDLLRLGTQVFTHGRGLIPDMGRALQAQRRAA